jgi:hypothetical protein
VVAYTNPIEKLPIELTLESIVCERPPRRSAPPLLFQEGNSLWPKFSSDWSDPLFYWFFSGRPANLRPAAMVSNDP